MDDEFSNEVKNTGGRVRAATDMAAEGRLILGPSTHAQSPIH